MPTKRTRVARRLSDSRITAEVIAAWKAGDYWRVHHGLGLRTWQMPMWNEEPVETDDRPLYMRRAYPAPDPRALKPLLIELAGPPPRRWYFKRDDAGRLVDDGLAD